MLTARWKFRGDGLCSAWIRRSALESERVAGCRLHDAEERLRARGDQDSGGVERGRLRFWLRGWP